MSSRTWLLLLCLSMAALAGPVSPAVAAGCASPYSVRSGDSLYRIAARCGTTVAALKAANGLSGSVIKVGQRLVIPGATSAAPTGSAPPTAQFGAGLAPGLNHAGTEKLVIANYFAWYDESTWSIGLTSDTPLVPYNSDDFGTMQRHLAWAQQAGLDGFAFHWFAPGDRTDANLQRFLSISASAGASETRPFRSSVTFLRHILPGATRQDVVAALRYIADAYGGNAHYLRLGGKMVVFFSDMPRVPGHPGETPQQAWASIRAEVDPGNAMLWFAEGLDPSYLATFDGLYVYKIDHRDYPRSYLKAPRYAAYVRSAERSAQRTKYWIGTIMPGWDDTRSVNFPDLRVPSPVFARDRAGGAYFQATFSAAIATQPDMLLVHSFNEWVEGSMIEPSVTYGDLYLNLAAGLAGQFRK